MLHLLVHLTRIGGGGGTRKPPAAMNTTSEFDTFFPVTMTSLHTAAKAAPQQALFHQAARHHFPTTVGAVKEQGGGTPNKNALPTLPPAPHGEGTKLRPPQPKAAPTLHRLLAVLAESHMPRRNHAKDAPVRAGTPCQGGP